MGIKQALFARMSAHAGLTALIGSGSSCRSWPDDAAKNPGKPYVVFFRVGNTRSHLGGSDSGVVRTRFQFDCYGATGDSAEAVAEQIIAALSRLRGTYAGVVIQDIYIDNQLSGVDDDTKLKIQSVDADIVYEGS